MTCVPSFRRHGTARSCPMMLWTPVERCLRTGHNPGLKAHRHGHSQMWGKGVCINDEQDEQDGRIRSEAGRGGTGEDGKCGEESNSVEVRNE